VTDLAVGAKIIGPDQIARIDLGFLDELVNVDGARRLQRDFLKLLLGDLDKRLLVERVAVCTENSIRRRRTKRTA
jgi:hypothetical protein